MASRTSHALGHVNAVIEINIVSQAMHAHPLNRLIGAITFADGFQVARAVKQHGMAIHACFGRRNPRRRGELHACVAIPAIDAIISDVVFVAELNRLITRYILIRQIGSTRRQEHSCQRQTRQKKRRKDTETGDEIRATVKNLRHVYVCTLEVSAPGGSGNLGVHQVLSGMCRPESKFDAMSFQQNFLECNCSTLFSLLFIRSWELKGEINSKVSSRRRVSTLARANLDSTLHKS